nr:DEAD/DEAH box helicase [Bacillus mesophilus]
MIKEMCGTVSFKRGDSFYRGNKIHVVNYTEFFCEAIVKGTEDFYVSITIDTTGTFQTTCSCPKLASFQKDCQHVAAVLLLLVEYQQKGSTPTMENHSDSLTSLALTEGLLTIFNNEPKHMSGQKLHFENREVLDVEFICKPFEIERETHILGIELKVGDTPVQNIRNFLQHLSRGKNCLLSLSFSYDPSLHCFQQENDDVLQLLTQVLRDEKVFVEGLPNEYTSEISRDTLLISPLSWDRLLPLLLLAPNVKLYYENFMFHGLEISTQTLPLQFRLIEREGKGYDLNVSGLQEFIILNSYQYILYKEKLIKLESEDFKRLCDLKEMLQVSGTNNIPVSNQQMGFFVEKVVPGLKKLGIVKFSEEILNQFVRTPLKAKLYLDRVKDRLLAGLEFQYENHLINPIEEDEPNLGSLIIRDTKAESIILELMDESSFIQTDSGYYLHNEELEYEFLYYMIPKLQKLVQIYATTAVRNRVFREKARPQIRVKVKKERTNWLQFKFEMNGIPDEDIKDVLFALEEKRKYYRLRNGSLLSLETKEFEEVHKFLHAFPDQIEHLENGSSISIIEGMKLLDSIETNDVFSMEKSFREFLKSIKDPGSLDFQVPKSIEFILRDYQTVGFKWMKSLANYGFGGILADDMGLGKTLQAITFALSVITEIRERKEPVLIVCPSSLTYNWLNELTNFAPELEAIVMDGNKQERQQTQQNINEIDVIIISYPLLRREVDWFEKQKFHTVFFDEAQVFKNPLTQTAKSVKKIQSHHKFALSGTPVENSIEELWSIFYVVFPELFRGLKEYSKLTNKTISRRIKPFLLRRLKEDVLAELPDKIESMDSAELFPEQKKLYAAYLAKLRHDTMKHLDKDTLRKNRIKILAGLTRLRQICCHPALFVDGYKGSSAKFEQLLRILEEARVSGRRVLIFSQFTKMLMLIGQELTKRGTPFFYLDGQTSSEERVEICGKFNSGERDCFLISLKAGGTGLNLTGADTVILYDMWWNPAVEEQAADRAYRMGQTKNVHVIKLVAKGTIEEKMNELQDKKRHLTEEIIHSNDRAASTLTEEDIKELLKIEG